MDQHDQDDLRLLARLHYGLGAVTAACTLLVLPLVCFSFRWLQDFKEAAARPTAQGTADIEMASMIVALVLAASVSLAVICLVHGAVLAYIGRLIARRRRRLLCLVFSVLHLINIPYGTALSVLAFILLRRPSVKKSFT